MEKEKEFFVSLSSWETENSSRIYNVSLYADKEGLSKILALESESKKLVTLATLYEQQARIQREIETLTKE